MNFNLLTKDQYEAFAQVILSSYPQSNPTTTEGFLKFLTDTYETDNTSFYTTVNEAQELVGGMRLLDYTLNIRNSLIQASGVGSVCVAPLHRKEKVAKGIVEYFLSQAINNNQSMAVLYPFKRTFYKSMGFGYGGKIHKYLLKPNAFPASTNKSSLRYLTKDDIGIILSCYYESFKSTNGMLSKTESDFKDRLSNFQSKVIGCFNNNKLTGFLIYEYRKADNRYTYEGNIEVIDFIYNDQDTLNQFFFFLNSQQNQVERIGLTTQDEYLDFKLLEAQNEQSHVFGDYELESYCTAIGLMYRIVSFEAFILQLKDTNFNNVTINICFDITDSLLDVNNTTFSVAFKNGCPSFIESDIDVTISIDISELSSLFMGAINFSSLLNLDLATLSHPNYSNQINTLFSYDQKPQCTTKF